MTGLSRGESNRGGIYGIDYGMQSPAPWTPPVWGCFPSTTNSLVNHNLTADDLTLTDGIMVAAAGGALRATGYGVKVTGAAADVIGASGTVAWKSENEYMNVTLFGQFKFEGLIGNPYDGVTLLSVTNSSGASFSIEAMGGYGYVGTIRKYL